MRFAEIEQGPGRIARGIIFEFLGMKRRDRVTRLYSILAANLENLRGPSGGADCRWTGLDGGGGGAFENSGRRKFPRYRCTSIPQVFHRAGNLAGLSRVSRERPDFSNFQGASQRDLPGTTGMHNTRNKARRSYKHRSRVSTRPGELLPGLRGKLSRFVARESTRAGSFRDRLSRMHRRA